MAAGLAARTSTSTSLVYSFLPPSLRVTSTVAFTVNRGSASGNFGTSTRRAAPAASSRIVFCFTSNETLPVRGLLVNRGPEPLVLIRSFCGLPIETTSPTVAWLSLQSIISAGRSATRRSIVTPRLHEFRSTVSLVMPSGGKGTGTTGLPLRFQYRGTWDCGSSRFFSERLTSIPSLQSSHPSRPSTSAPVPPS